MKNFKIYLAYVALLAMVMTSCSKEDSPDSPDGGPVGGDKMVALSFNSVLKDFNEGRAPIYKQSDPNPTNQGENALPECSDADPTAIRVAILDENEEWVSGEEFFEIPVIPNGDGGWMTEETDDIELPEGDYSLEYFAVLAGEDIIYIAPREDDDYGPAEYQNFVDDALPIDIDLREGVKKYVDVEVLCYDKHFVYSYGYLFFDFEEVDIVYLCLFGNVCDEDGRHYPASFKFDVWELNDEGLDPKGNLLYSDENETGTYDNGDDWADPLCVALPDYGEGEEDVYYGELSLYNEETEEWEVIRMGAFSQSDVESLELTGDAVPEGYDSASNYYHFREGACSNQDDSDPCLFSEPVKYANHFDGADPFAFKGWDGTEYNEETTIAANSLWEEGEFTFTDNPRNVHDNWIDEEYHANMMLFNGNPEIDQAAYFATTMEDVCPHADYFVKFNLRNVLAVQSGSENDVRLVIRTGGEDGDLIVDGSQNPQVITADESDGWLKVGLRLKADAAGVLDFRLENDETERNGNDFAIDDMIISNDPTIVNGADRMIIE